MRSYKRLAPMIANYTSPHPALFPNQGHRNAAKLNMSKDWIEMLLLSHHGHKYRKKNGMVRGAAYKLRIKMSE